MSKPSDFFGGSINIESNKNLLINGNFDIWQRGTTQTTSGYGSADRWKFNFVGTNSPTRQSFDVGQTDVPNNPTYYCRNIVGGSSAVTTYYLINQAIEDVALSSGRTLSYSFWAKADSAKDMCVEFAQNFGSGGSSYLSGVGIKTFTLTTNWQKFTGTVTMPSVLGKTIGGGSRAEIVFWLSAGSNYDARTNSLGNSSGGNYDIAQVQLEYGDEVTDFEMRTFGGEYRMCQRYYQRLMSIDGAANQYHTSYTRMNTIRYPVIMRATPSVTVITIPSFAGFIGTVGALHSTYTTSDHIAPIYKWTSGSAGRAIHFGGFTAYLDAEL